MSLPSKSEIAQSQISSHQPAPHFESGSPITRPPSLFSWRGLSLAVPADWEPGAFDGDDDQGYVRLDDELIARCEIRWTKVKSETEFSTAVDRLTDGLEKAAAKGKSAWEFHMHDISPEITPKSLSSQKFVIQAYSWRDEKDFILLAVYCPDCKRMTLLHLTDVDTNFARSIVSSFSDHADEGPSASLRTGGTWWRLYRFALRTPNDWKLVTHNFAAGLLELDFVGPNHLHARVRRWGPAEILLKQTTPAVSAVERLEKFWRERSPWMQPRQEITKDSIRGHESLHIELERQGWTAKLSRVLPTFKAREQKKGFSVCARAWYCAASNRIYAVEVFAPTLDATRTVGWEIECHDE